MFVWEKVIEGLIQSGIIHYGELFDVQGLFDCGFCGEIFLEILRL